MRRESNMGDQWFAGWAAARTLFQVDTHGMPMPVWATRGFMDKGPAAWERLTRIASERNGALSIYAHLPFCLTRCPFCDCHAASMPRESSEVVPNYMRRFRQEARQWSEIGDFSRRPVTTVHLGGGTPHALDRLDFESVVRSLSAGFTTNDQTEWAVETNCRCLDNEHIDQLSQLGFTRIHVGLQTLQPRLRSILGRHLPPDEALGRISACLQRGWIVSVDMLYGLPEQTTDDLIADLECLVKTGIHGVSLYRLNHGRHNHPFMVRYGLGDRGVARLYADYQMFMEAAGLLTSAGYSKNHFTHFAIGKDRNLYSRHAVRGEDLLALGATSDGVFGDYYYRHEELAAYLKANDGWPPLQGGGTYTHPEWRARRVVTQLMAAQIYNEGLDSAAVQFVRRLEAAHLLSWEEASNSWRLTDTGSWFIGQCAADALRLYEM